MHGRPRDYKNKLKDPKAADAYGKKVLSDRSKRTQLLYSLLYSLLILLMTTVVTR
jgi:hypothetical protein